MAKPILKMPFTAFIALLLCVYLPAAFGHEVSLSCPAAFGPIPDASGLIAYYPLDGNTADVSGNRMDAVEVNAVTPAPGKVGQGYYFNGKDSFIRLAGDITPTVYPQITITAWIKPEAVNGARYIVNQGNDGNRSLFISNGAVSAGRALVGDQRHTVFAGRWVFVALTYDHATNTAVLLSDVTISAAEATVPEQPRPSILLGAKSPGNSVFAGVLDEIRIYNRALTTTELAGLNRAGNDAFAYPQTDVFASSNAGDLLGDAVAPSSQPGQPLFDENPTQLPGDQFAGAVTDGQGTQQLSDYGRISLPDPATDAALAESAQLAELQLAGIDPAAVTKPVNKEVPIPGGPGPVSRTAVIEPISADDIPTGPDYQVVDQNVDYVAEGTYLAEGTFMPEPSDDGPSGGTRTSQQPLASETVLAYAPGEAQLTEISGRRGSIVQVHMDVQWRENNNRVGTNDWEVWETNDKLCEINTAFAIVRECGENEDGRAGSYKSARFNLPTSRVTALQVCTRKSNGRVKGIRIRGVGLSRTAPSGLDNVSEQAELAYSNCNDNWKALVMCPSGQIAAGLKAHFDPGRGTSKQIPALVGLQLYCRALTFVPASG